MGGKKRGKWGKKGARRKHYIFGGFSLWRAVPSDGTEQTFLTSHQWPPGIGWARNGNGSCFTRGWALWRVRDQFITTFGSQLALKSRDTLPPCSINQYRVSRVWRICAGKNCLCENTETGGAYMGGRAQSGRFSPEHECSRSARTRSSG